MTQPVTRKLTLGDVMILVATTGVSLSCYLFLDNALFRGERYLYGLFEPPTNGWTSAKVVDRAAGILALMLPLFGGWTLAIPVLRLRSTRPGWRRLNRQAGMTACVAAMTGMAICGGVAGCASLLRQWVDGRAPLPPNFWARVPLFDVLIVDAGVSVAAVWLTQAVTGLWRPSVDWVDRLGRSIGCLWVAAGLVFSVRLLMG